MAKNKKKVDKNSASTSKKRPTGVTVIAVLNFIGFALGIIGALLFLVGGSVLVSNPNFLTDALTSQGVPVDSATYIPVAGGALVVFGIFVGLLAVISLILGIGLLKGKNWARIVEIVFSGIGIIFALMSLFSGRFVSFLFNAIIYGLIFWYLTFNKNTLSYFKK